MTTPKTPLAAFGARLGGHAGLYGSGALIGFVLGLANVAVLTRLLDIGEFGQLSLLLLLSTLLTVLFNLGSLQGALLAVFGGGDEEGAADEEDEEIATGNKGRALGTAMAVTLLVGVLGTAALVPVAPALADGLLGERSLSGAVLLASASAVGGAAWRLAWNVPRYERRPRRFVVLGTLRPILVLACSIPLVSAGYGVNGAIGGVAMGTALALLIVLAVTHRSYALAFNIRDARLILSRGGVVIPLVLSLWVLHNADLYLVSVFGSDAEVAQFRVASRIAAGISYFVSAVVMAWGPLTRSSLYRAVAQEHGRAAAGSAVFTWFVLGCCWILLGLAVLADIVIRIAPEDYASAAPLIPLVALAFVSYGVFVIVNRGSHFPRKRRVYIGLAVVAAIAFGALGFVLVPLLGGYGAALAQIVAFAGVSVILTLVALRSGTTVRVDAVQLVRGVGLAGLLLAAGTAVGHLLGPWRIATDLLAVAAFPSLLIATGALTRSDARRLTRLALEQLRGRSSASGAELLTALSLEDRLLLERILRRREDPAEAAARAGIEKSELLERMVAALRRASGAARPSPSDAALGAYLLLEAAPAERDVQARRLWKARISPLDIDLLEVATDRLKNAPPEVWRSELAAAP